MKNIKLNKIRQKIKKIKNINLSYGINIKEYLQEELDRNQDNFYFTYMPINSSFPIMEANIDYDKNKKEFTVSYHDLKAIERDYEQLPRSDDDDEDLESLDNLLHNHSLEKKFSNIDDLVKFLDKEFSDIDFN